MRQNKRTAKPGQRVRRGIAELMEAAGALYVAQVAGGCTGFDALRIVLMTARFEPVRAAIEQSPEAFIDFAWDMSA